MNLAVALFFLVAALAAVVLVKVALGVLLAAVVLANWKTVAAAFFLAALVKGLFKRR